ncbi:hypothetical protein EST38_g12732 [Candolleomyces aberdarensis]|uniref:Uncharacterized protein n=1 Tax=Candolleomyces aberdarensis TaxID=2316362 RepID=A0A4Q2D2T8_9AGAR|nr:hypothetical protein EST38_g12732 [Candolleomyces aberdarensis]
MPWHWPAEGLLLPAHLLGGDQLPWDTASERLITAVLTASQRVLSAKPAFAHLFCDLAKTLLVKNLVALSCEIAPVTVLPVPVAEEIIYIPTRTAPVSTITPAPELIPQFTPQAGPNTLLEYVPPPDYMDLIIPYSLMFIWFIGTVLLVIAFSSGGLSCFKRTLQASSSSRLHADKRDENVRATSPDMRIELEPPVDQAFISPPASYSLRFPIPSMAQAAGLLVLLTILFGGSLPLDFASQLVAAVTEAVQPVLRLAIMPYLVNIFSGLAKTLRVENLPPFPCDISALIDDIVLPLSPPAWPDVVAKNFVPGYDNLIDVYFPVVFLCVIGMEEPRRPQAPSIPCADRWPENRHEDLRQASSDMGSELEPLADQDSISPPAVYVVGHEITYKKLIYVYYEEGESTPFDVETFNEFVSHRQKTRYDPDNVPPSRFTEIVEDPVQSVDEPFSPITPVTPSSDAASPTPPVNSTSGEGTPSEFLENLSSSSTVDYAPVDTRAATASLGDDWMFIVGSAK